MHCVFLFCLLFHLFVLKWSVPPFVNEILSESLPPVTCNLVCVCACVFVYNKQGETNKGTRALRRIPYTQFLTHWLKEILCWLSNFPK